MEAGQGNAKVWPSSNMRLLLACMVLFLHATTLYLAISQQSALTDDSIQYLRIADNLATEATFSQAYFHPLVPDAQRTPGYPVFLILLGRNITLVLLLQHLLCLATAWMLFRLLRTLVGGRWAAIVGWSYALMPYPAIFASMVLSESLFIFLFVAAFGFLVRWLDSGGARSLLLGMLGLGLAALVRPVAWPVMVCMFPLVLLWIWRKKSPKPWLAMTALALPFLIPLSWALRTEQVSGQLALSTMGDMGMIHGRLGGLEAHRQGLGTDEHALYMCGDSLAAQLVGLPQLRNYYSSSQTHETEMYAPGMGGLTLGYFLQHPLDAIAFQSKSLFNMLAGVGKGWARNLGSSAVLANFLAGLQFLFNLGMYLGLLLGCWRIRKWAGWQWLAMAWVAIVLLVSAAAWADGRYRMVVDPLILALAVAAWAKVKLPGRSAARGLQ